MFDDTIAAISTASADGAISIVRLSGSKAVEIANSIASTDLFSQPSHTIRYATIHQDNGEALDEVMISVFKAPKTYTREDVVEINTHGGSFVTHKVLELLLSKGARLARPGEFTQRAFLHGRIDLSQAEAVEEIIEAGNVPSVTSAVSALKGSVQKLIDPLIERLTVIIAAIEVNIDYPEYDCEEMTYKNLLPQMNSLIEEMDRLIESAKRNALYKKGLDTVIVGKPNVGKSSLLNALLEEDKAIVSDLEGTTRDIVEGQIRLKNYQLNLIDTAGIREGADQIEQLGIEKAKDKIDQADLVLLVLDGSRELDTNDEKLLEMTKEKNRLILLNKEDLSEFRQSHPKGIAISARENNLEALYSALEELFQFSSQNPKDTLQSARQIGLLAQAKADMIKAKEAMEEHWESDLIEIDLLNALDHLKEILGRNAREDLLDALFSRFCLGK